MDGYDRTTYGHSFADVYDEWYADVSDVGGTVDYIAELAHGGGRVLELGVGSGRLAVPLAEAGIDVRGLDASAEMLSRMPVGAPPAVLADMTDPPFRPASFDVAFVAFNTLFNLTTEPSQRQCLTATRRLLRPGGHLVVETFVPSEPDGASDTGLSTRTVEVDRVVLTATISDPDTQTIMGQHIEITEAGIRLRPWHLRYLMPEQLDAMAEDADFTLVHRWADWHRTPFDESSPACVTTYRTSP